MPVNAKKGTNHEDAVEYYGAVAEMIVYKLGFRKSAPNIGRFVKKLVERMQKGRVDRRVAAGGQAGVMPAGSTRGPVSTVSRGRV